MNVKFKIGGIAVKAQFEGTPVDVNVENFEIEVTDVAIREVPVLITALKDMVIDTETAEFQREVARNSLKRHQSSPQQRPQPRHRHEQQAPASPTW